MKRPLRAVFAAAVAVAAAAAQTVNGLKADVSFLASDALQGRGTPSPGLDVAAEFIAAQFRRAGLEPPGGDGYFQNAPFENVTPNLDGLELTIESGGSKIKADKRAMGLQVAAAVSLSHAPAIKVSMANPAALDALPPDQTRGKVLLLDIPDGAARGVTRRIQAAAARLLPALVIVFLASPPRANGNTVLREASVPAIPVLNVWDPDARAAARSMPADTTVSAHIAAPAVVPVKLHNVIGILRGSDPVLKDTYLLLTAHYDHLGVRDGHIFYGANDDASGTASVVEIANALAALQQRPKRSIVFMAHFGEELGDLGSRYYAQHPVFPLAKTIADLNLEQLGRTDDLEGPRVSQFNLTGFNYTDLPAALRKAGAETGIRVVNDEKNSDAYFARSDNAAYADAGIPATTISVAYDYPDYHKAGDEWPKLDYENLAKVDRTIAIAVLGIANNPQPPAWDKSNPKTARYVRTREQTAGAK